MKPLNKTHQILDSLPFTEGIIMKVRKYETKRKNKQRALEATAIIFFSYLLLINPGYLINKSHHNNPLTFDGITEDLMQLNHQKKLIQSFGFNTGKITKVNLVNYTHT